MSNKINPVVRSVLGTMNGKPGTLSTTEVDSAKVARFRQEIECGAYVIQPGKIADALLRSDLKLSK